MKFTTLLVLITTLQLSASVYSQGTTFSMEFKGASVLDLMAEIKKNSEFDFVYSDDEIENVSINDVNFSGSHVEEILDRCLEGTAITFQVDDKVIVLMPAPPKPILKEVKQEKKELKGTVTDADGNTLPGVSVVVKGTTNGTATDIDGNYLLVIEQENIVLVFSFVGMTTQELTYSGQEVQNVSLDYDAEGLDEVVIVGYGKVDKKDLTGTVSTVRSDELSLVKTQTIDGALAGQMTGVHVSASGGAPGSGNVVHIRGLSGISGDNQPLYVVDGVPIIQNPNFGTNSLGMRGIRENPLMAINPNDIQRVDVLKDASAAAIYGSRAANGVVLITTKRGKRNMAPKVNFSVDATIQNPTDKFDYLNAGEWKEYVQEQAQVTLNSVPQAFWSRYPKQVASLNDPSYFGTSDTDWQDKITNKNALWTQYNMNVSGGSESVNYMVSASVSDQEGLMIGNRLKRYSISSSLDASITKRFKVGTSINYSYSINKSSNISSLGKYGAFRPDIAVYNQDGSLTTYEGNYGVTFNPLGDAAKVKNKAIGQNLYGSIYGELEILKDMKFKSAVNIGLNGGRVSNFQPSYTEYALFQAKYYDRGGARLTNQRNDGYTISFENTLNYSKTFNDIHKLNVLAGVSWDKSRLDLESQTYLGFPDDNVLTNINSANEIIEFQSEAIENGLNSVFGRINYVYNSKYMATFTARYDGSTKFGPDNRRGFFPSGALAWNMHHEDFLSDSELINKLKLRASLGRTGSDNLPAFSYLPYYQSQKNGRSKYDNINGIVVTGVPNRSIKWESTDQLDLGLEFGLFNNRLYGELVYFEKNTNDIILGVTIPAQTGSSRWQDNIAEVSNRGWEIMLAGDIIRTKDFTWTSAFNISFVKNKVENLNGGTPEQYFTDGIVEGEPVGTVYGYDVIKIAQTQEEIDVLNNSAGGKYQLSLTKPGDYIFRDLDGDGKVTTTDMKALGDINPDYYGGWNNKISYKNFDLGVNWAFVQGSEKAFQTISGLNYPSIDGNVTTIIYDTWTPEKTNAKYARLGSPTHGRSYTSRSVVDASYIRLRTVSLSYNLPKNLLLKLGVSNAKLSLSGNNLLTITDYPGMDPESVNSQRGGATVDMTSDRGQSYPQAKTYTIGLNVTF